MKFKVIEIIDINIGKELERLTTCFSGPCLARIANIVYLFNKGDFDQSWQAYLDLPYNEENECPEQEFLPFWYAAFYEKYAGGDVGFPFYGKTVESRSVEVL